MNRLKIASLPLFLFLLSASIGRGGHGHGQEKDLYQFVRNDGQWHPQAEFKAGIKGGKVYLERDRFTFVLLDQEDMSRMHRENHEGSPYSATEPISAHAYSLYFKGAENGDPKGKEPYSHYQNYFIGDEPSSWASKVPVFREVKYDALYPGIGLKAYSQDGHFKYDYRIEPEGDPERLRFGYEGAENTRIDSGDLVIHTSVGKMLEKSPLAYQIIDGEKVEVPCEYKALDNGLYTFSFPNGYDASHELIIDPTVVAATYSGSTSTNYGHTATYDRNNKPFSAGASFSGGNYPTTSGAFQINPNGSREFCITKFNPDGSAQEWATYVGGSGDDFPHSMMVDSAQNLYILGSSSSSDYPTSSGAYQTSNGGGSDIVVTGLSSNGASLVGSTYLGGSSSDGQNGPLADNYGDEYKGEIFVGKDENVYIASMSSSSNFPTTSGVIQTSHNGAQDGVLCKLNGDMSNLLWSTYLGTSGDDAAYNIERDPSSGEVYASGTAGSSGFPTTAGVVHPSFIGGSADGFVVRMNSSATSLIASSYVGSASRDQGFFLERSTNGEVFVLGQTESTSMSSSPGVYEGPISGSTQRSFIRRYTMDLTNNNLTSVFNSVAPTAFLVDHCNNIYAAGHGGLSQLGPSDYDTTSNAYDGDGAGFYLLVLEQGATSLKYATFFGNSDAHVDGGTSRFDPRGTVYETVCTSSGSPTVSWAWATSSGASWDHYLFKLDPETAGLFADASFQKDVVACGGPPVNVNFNSNNSDTIDHYWDFGDGTIDSVADPAHSYTDTGDFTVTYVVTDSTTCNIMDTMSTEISIELPDSFWVDMNLPSYNNCRDADTLAISPSFQGNNIDSSVWNMGDGTQFVNDTSVNHVYMNPGTHVLEVQVWSPCDSTITVTDTISYSDQELMLNPSPSPDTVLCGSYDPVQFDNGAPDSIQHYWDFGDGDTSNAADPTHTFTDSGTYQITYIGWDSSYCNVADTSTLTIPVYEPPEVSADWNDPNIPPCKDSALFQARFTGQGADSIVWDLGDGTVITGDTSVNKLYTEKGEYQVMMTVYDDECEMSDSTSTSFTIDRRIEEGDVLVPNVFTPNGDGKNDSFHLRYKESAGDQILSDLGHYQLRVYNRWGKLLFVSGDDRGSWRWDGRIDGRKAKEGTYFYIIEFKGGCEEEAIKKKSGNMSLLRNGPSTQ